MLLLQIIFNLAWSALLVSAKAAVRGVNLGGWLLIEEWMFSNGIFDRVAESKDTPQGVVFPPSLPNGFGENWYAEGDLVNRLYNKFGAERTIEIMTAHRESYITASDFQLMAANGISRVRLPLGWWAFANESTQSTPVLISDPVYYYDRKFVTITNSFLKQKITEIHNAGLEVLLDIHAFPGGSADGSYNGIFPYQPLFFKDDSLKSQGFDIVNALCDFYDSLGDNLRSAVTGITIMNEPAHLLSDDSEAMQTWLSSAIDIYRQRIANKYPKTPLLFVNLIGTSISDQGMLDFMLNTFSTAELNSWAVLDVHVYYAWNSWLSGCMTLNGDCGYACSVDNDEAAFKGVSKNIFDSAASSHSYWKNNGSVPLIGCSEFSLATYHDGNTACRGRNFLELMYDAQASGFESQGMLDMSLFWTWKMPYGGSNENSWSLQDYLHLK